MIGFANGHPTVLGASRLDPELSMASISALLEPYPRYAGLPDR
jgi:hypothetical protein